MASVLQGTGRRKNSTARIRVIQGSGKVIVNKKDVKEYFDREIHIIHLMGPVEAASFTGKYDIFCNVKGGGKTGQSGAIRMGIARALAKTSENVQVILAKGGFLTRDSRMVERKKYGQKKARKSFQYSKR